jgi:hypothetical protein
MRTPISSGSYLSPMGLRTSSFAPASVTVKSETELKAAITMALKSGQKPIVIGKLWLLCLLHLSHLCASLMLPLRQINTLFCVIHLWTVLMFL